MFSWTPRHAEVLLLCDVRTLADANADAQQKPEPGAQSVLSYFWPGIEVWGKRGWDSVARVALFEFGTDVTPKLRAQAKAELVTYLEAHKGQFRHIIVLQSRSKSARKVYTDDYAESSHTGTVCFDFFSPPGPFADMAGCFWEPGNIEVNGTSLALNSTLVLPLLNPQNVDYVYGAMVIRWLTAVYANTPVFRPPPETTWTEPGEGMTYGLGRLLDSASRGLPITFDLETFSTQDLITVIGLSDGKHTVSVPWEPFSPHGQSYVEPGLHLASAGQVVRRIFATAKTLVGHNIHRHDIPYLKRKGIQLTGRPFDTYLAHGAVYGQFRHGLQQVTSYEFVVPPWKLLHLTEDHDPALTPDDPEFWTQSPPKLRVYNSLDTFYNHWDGVVLARYGGVRL